MLSIEFPYIWIHNAFFLDERFGAKQILSAAKNVRWLSLPTFSDMVDSIVQLGLIFTHAIQTMYWKSKMAGQGKWIVTIQLKEIKISIRSSFSGFVSHNIRFDYNNFNDGTVSRCFGLQTFLENFDTFCKY